MVKKLIAGCLLSIAVLLMVGTAAFAGTPPDAGIPPGNASCIAACSHACVQLKDWGFADLFVGNNFVPAIAHGDFATGAPGASAKAQMTTQEECIDLLHMDLHR